MPKEKTTASTGLIYTGKGFYADVPARDLSAEEVAQFGGVELLTKDGYYRLSQTNEVNNGN